MSKNSPKRGSDRLPSDGSVSPFDSSPAIREGSGGGAGTAEATTFSFTLERVVLSLLAGLKPGQAVEFVEESVTAVSASRSGQAIGYVPQVYRERVKGAVEHGYSAAIEDVSHETVRVRVTA